MNRTFLKRHRYWRSLISPVITPCNMYGQLWTLIEGYQHFKPSLQRTNIHPKVNLFHLIGMGNYYLDIKYLKSLKLRVRNTSVRIGENAFLNNSNVSECDAFYLVEILKNLLQKGFEKKEKMHEHLQQSSSMEEDESEHRVWCKVSRKYKIKWSVSSLTGQNCDLPAVCGITAHMQFHFPPAKRVCPALWSVGSFSICKDLHHSLTFQETAKPLE